MSSKSEVCPVYVTNGLTRRRFRQVDQEEV